MCWSFYHCLSMLLFLEQYPQPQPILGRTYGYFTRCNGGERKETPSKDIRREHQEEKPPRLQSDVQVSSGLFWVSSG